MKSISDSKHFLYRVYFGYTFFTHKNIFLIQIFILKSLSLVNCFPIQSTIPTNHLSFRISILQSPSMLPFIVYFLQAYFCLQNFYLIMSFPLKIIFPTEYNFTAEYFAKINFPVNIFLELNFHRKPFNVFNF